jgi:hypothetical protein
MKTENTEQIEASPSVTVEDLTLNETDSGNVKAGAVDQFLKITDVKGESRDYK